MGTSFVLIMHLLVHDCDTGLLLYARDADAPSFSISGKPRLDCITSAIPTARRIAMRFRANGYPNASANVTCRWERPTI